MDRPKVKRTFNLEGEHPSGWRISRTGPGSSGRNSAHPNFLTRGLHSLLFTPSRDASRSPCVRQANRPTRSVPRFLKVRIVTWNMHDVLPKGDLADLLGTVPPYVPIPPDAADKLQIPGLTTTDGHPYHLVVVAGQECPTVSGIPLGLGGFKIIEKERSRENGTKPDARHKRKSKDGKEKERPLLEHRPNTESEVIKTSLLENTFLSNSPLVHTNSHVHNSGWSWILEGWFCRGFGQKDNGNGATSATNVFADAQISADATVAEVQHTASPNGNGHDAKRKKKDRKDFCERGPYELLAKERLMGIYLAVFIYRDLKPLVRGISKSAVTSGLIGGRLGNKGGVGISIDLDGTTLLFANCHLAAHEGRVQHRLNNMAKIKAELQVDDFLSQDDPRVMSEDITDRFDHTFLFGDLNFRLNVTRLHADWLVSRQEYEQAMHFDQLYEVMRSGRDFVNFNEAPIRFPPTFKYDVMKSLKREKSHSSNVLKKSRRRRRRRRRRAHTTGLSEVEEKELEDAENADEEGDVDDSSSETSSSDTSYSSHSRRTISVGDTDYDDYFNQVSSSNGAADNDRSAQRLAHKAFLVKAALKAREKWRFILSATSLTPPTPMSGVSTRRTRSRHDSVMTEHGSPSEPLIRRSTGTFSPGPMMELPRAASAVELNHQDANGSVDIFCPTYSKSSKSATARPKDNDNDCGKGVYDSSSKQRVPSWCDRILWKSTAHPGPESEEEPAPNLQTGLGPRVMQLFSQAFRPLSLRGRNSSQISLRSVSMEPVVMTSSPKVDHTGADAVAEVPAVQLALTRQKRRSTLPNFLMAHREFKRPPKLYKSKSVEPVVSVPRAPSKDAAASLLGRPISATHIVSEPAVITSSISAPNDSRGTPQFSKLPSADTTASMAPRPLPAKGSSSSWRFLPFRSRETAQAESASHTPAEGSDEPRPAQPVTPRPRRGDVIPLSYNTLDDQAMRRLAGRSDHRPVVGSYAIYV